MAKFCRYCGRELKEGEVCYCHQTEAAEKTDMPYKEINKADNGDKAEVKNVADNIKEQKITEKLNNSAKTALRNTLISKIQKSEEFAGSLRYTNTIRHFIGIMYVFVIIISLIVGLAVFNTVGVLIGLGYSSIGQASKGALIMVEIFFAYLGYKIAAFIVARLGMQMEMSYNLEASRIYLNNIQNLLLTVYGEDSGNESKDSDK